VPRAYRSTYGIGTSLMSSTLSNVFRGKYREVHPGLYVVSLAFIIYFLRHALGLVV